MPAIKTRRLRMSLEQRSLHARQQREQRIKNEARAIKSRFGRSESRVTLDMVKEAFPYTPWDIIKPAVRMLADRGQIKYHISARAVDQKSVLRRSALEQLLRTSKRKLKRAEIVRMLAEHYGKLKNPIDTITLDLWRLDPKLLMKIIPESSNEGKIQKVKRAIMKDPTISNAKLAKIAGVGKRELSYMLENRISRQLKADRVWHGFSAKQRGQQNTAIVMGVRRSLTIPNIRRNIRILSSTDLNRKLISDRIKSLTGHTHTEILAQNAVIVEGLQARKSPNEIAKMLRARGYAGLDAGEIGLRINALSPKAAR